MPVAAQVARLARHSAIYGAGDLVARFLGVLLLPLYTAYLSPADYGAIEILVAASAVLLVVLRRGISDGFFRFYFESSDSAYRTTLVRTSFWFTMSIATTALVVGVALAEPLARLLQLGDEPDLVRAAAVGLWAQLNYSQLTAVYRAEERSVAFVWASLANVVVTIAVTVLLVAILDQGPLGAIVGGFAGTLTVYAFLLVRRRADLGLEFNRQLLREVNRFGTPLIPAALALWAISFVDRWFIAVLADQAEVGVYSVAVRVASAVLMLQLAFRRAWLAFAYSIEDDEEARGTFSYVLTYIVYLTCWAALALAALAPWLVRLLTSNPGFDRASDAVPLLAFSAVAYAGFSVISIGPGRARRTQGNWIVAGVAAIINVAVCIVLIPDHGMMGAAVATLLGYVGLFLGMLVYTRRVYPVHYQWRRVVTALSVAVGLAVLATTTDPPLIVAIAISAVFPLALFALRFYLPGERKGLRRLLSSRVGRSRRQPREG